MTYLKEREVTGPFNSKVVKNVSQHYEITAEQLLDLLAETQAILEEKIASFYDRAWHDRAFNHLTESEYGVWFGLGRYEFKKAVDGSFTQVERDAIQHVHQHEMREQLNHAVHTRRRVDDRLPVYIKFPEGWNQAMWGVESRFYYLLRHSLSPAELLDYWLHEYRGMEVYKLAGWREVGDEAVRKNIRQAREKLENRNDFYHPAQQTVLVSLDDVDEEGKVIGYERFPEESEQDN